MTLSGWIRGAAALAIVTAFAAPAWAQSAAPSGGMGNSGGGLPMPGIELGGERQVDPATAEKRKEIDRAYRDATRAIPAQAAATNDPWAKMRGPDDAKSAAAPKAGGKTTTTAAQKKKSPAQ